MSTNNYIAKLKLRLDQAITQRDHWKQLAENRNSILVTEVCPESRSVEEYIIDADSVRASWRLIRGYREQIEALRGLTPELPPRPPEGAGLPRYGLRWNGPAQPLSVPMDDGYWTPWHLAEALRAENGRLRESSRDVRALAASLYQACGAYDMPERILDALSAAANGEPFTHMIDGLLPCVPPSGEGVRSLVEALEECAAALAWNCFGECRAVHAGPIMPAAMALDTALAALATHRQAQRQ